MLVSVGAHLAIVAAMLFLAGRAPVEPEQLPAPAVEVVFEGGQPERAEAEPPPGIEAPPSPPAPPEPAAPPALPAPPVAQPPIPSPPVPPAPPPPAVAAVEPPPVPALPLAPSPVPPPPEPPPQVAEEPQAPPLPPIAELVLPPPPEMRLRERVETPPAPPQPAPPRSEAAPALPPGTIFLPGGLQLSQPSGRPRARGLDLTVDPRLAEGNFSADPSVRVSGAQVGPDWRAAFRRWLDQNLRYPLRAAELGESGTVRVVVTADPDGRVRSVRLVGPSASPSLNLGTTFPFRGATLPAFPPPADPNGITVDLTVNYILIRR